MAILERRFAAGKPCKPLEEKVVLYPLSWSVWNAFWSLGRTRQYTASGAPLGILLSEMKAWVEMFPVYDIKEFVGHLLLLDHAYLNHQHEKMAKDAESEQRGKKKAQ